MSMCDICVVRKKKKHIQEYDHPSLNFRRRNQRQGRPLIDRVNLFSLPVHALFLFAMLGREKKNLKVGKEVENSERNK